jgi:hypothetical protein
MVLFKMSKLPISVIVPHKKSRKEFFEGYCLPSIRENNPQEIIIIDEEGSAAVKRNKGAAQAKGEYLFFCDDDVILNSKCLERNLEVLTENPSASFSYSSFLSVSCIPMPPGSVSPHHARDWDPEVLLSANYIDTGSLIRKEAFMGFDETLAKFEDWELWIRMMKNGKIGVFTKRVLFLSFRIDASVTISIPNEPSLKRIREKHPEFKA